MNRILCRTRRVPNVFTLLDVDGSPCCSSRSSSVLVEKSGIPYGDWPNMDCTVHRYKYIMCQKNQICKVTPPNDDLSRTRSKDETVQLCDGCAGSTHTPVFVPYRTVLRFSTDSIAHARYSTIHTEYRTN